MSQRLLREIAMAKERGVDFWSGRADIESGLTSMAPSAGPADLTSADLSGNHLGKVIANLIKDNKVDMTVHKLVVEAVELLPKYKLQEIINDLFEDNRLVQTWFHSEFKSRSVIAEAKIWPHCDKVTKFAISPSYITMFHNAVIKLVRGNKLIIEGLKDKLLIKQEDGTFAIRKFAPDTSAEDFLGTTITSTRQDLKTQILAMARTVASQNLLESAANLDRTELRDLVVELIDKQKLTMEEIQEGLDFIEEKYSTTRKIVEAMEALPRHKLREVTIELIQSDHEYQRWLVDEWQRIFHDLEERYEGDPYEGDPYALIVFMDEHSSTSLRIMIVDMSVASTCIRNWLKDKLLTADEDGKLEIREFEPDSSPEI
ncbi:hypothetical protein SBOR_7034 [Sclerotinia borealis F-4128]|uniref:Uncharacterized protein n=1 Tax=Sclerotinia borealis (strain F-4128) TaxID=1432307 RepID=W9CCL9_SCLBF|nr:hypothetical protein SBOR_7034 [Sclerotinia borealis F-4128]